MSLTRDRIDPFSHLTRLVIQYPLRWAVPAVLITLAAAAYAVVHQPKWEASLPMIVRNEATTTAAHQKPGRFERLEQMQTVQETILELSRSRRVVAAALTELGPPAGKSVPAWPTARDVARTRKAVTMTPPQGAVFGKTEVFYLKVKDKHCQRAIDLAAAISRHVQQEYQRLRNRKAESMTTELVRSVKLAQDELNNATGGLADLETRVAGDLAELRILQRSPSGNSDLRRRLNTVENELRAAQQAMMASEELFRLLDEAQTNPGRLLATPNRLLEAQPALRRLKDGLVDAQLATARLEGQLTGDHPEVLAAKAAEEEIGRHLSGELGTAMRGVKVELRLNKLRVVQLEEELAGITQRLQRLASVRAEYGQRLEEIVQLTQVLQSAQQNLAEARASRAAAHVASLITVIDQPETGTQPLGPGRVVILFSGLVGGLVVGLGIVFVTAPLDVTPPAGQPHGTLLTATHPSRSKIWEALFSLQGSA
ncbi:MAG: hypothetical protein GTO53_04390 [Planctomycetales bacterium]|nr:hypothetical protein [Planctomycetales bacterium]NIM08396.1 hypothetical protein [Planctomycetales bacterium]NIN07871.1 hypothetical protein [Planctomycetales bacterium]NIN77001.1 hypothetical protein [Planctomycetales bacterium]NIO34184.1 hypothetical protein [Planctomycetales bacterium]